jgi:hydroxymethylbilane synthase
MKLRLGTRGSLLARTQAGHVADWLRTLGHEVEMIFITTEGDRRTELLAEIGGKGLFLKEIEEALLRDEIDFAVHSLKDVPAEVPDGLLLTGYSKREDVRDAWISKSGDGVGRIAKGARVGTGSLRRGSLLSDVRPDFTVVPIRGNVDTRLRKLEEGEFDAIVLASAGLRRLDRISAATELLDPARFTPAPGQGILAFECRENAADVRSALVPISHPESEWAARAERKLLGALGGDCRTPLGAWAHREDGVWQLDAFYRAPGAPAGVRGAGEARPEESPESLAERVAAQLVG